MSKVEDKGRHNTKYNQFDQLDTATLEAILRADFDAPEAEQIAAEEVLYIANLVAERRNMPRPDIDKAQEEFYQYYYPLDEPIYDFGDEDNLENRQAKNNGFYQKVWRRFASAAAVLVLFVFGGTVAAYAWGDNPIATIGRWTEDFFWFEPVVVTSELSEKLIEQGYPENIVPKWIPAGYTLDSIDEAEYENSFKFISATYVKPVDDELETLIISYTINLGGNSKSLYEKDRREVSQYAIEDRVYYVMTNLDDRVITWQNGDFEGAIMGKFTMEEAKKIINSIYGE